MLVALAKIGVSLALVIPVMVIMFLMMFGIGASEMSPDAEMTALLSAMGAFYLILIVPLLFVEMIFLYTFPLIIDRGMGAGEAMGASWRACWRHPWGTTKIVVLNALLWMLGSLCCVVPFFLVLPVTYGVIWLGYREIFGPPPAPCPSERQPSCQTKSS